MSKSRSATRARSSPRALGAQPVELDADADRQARIPRRCERADVGVEVGVRRLVPEHVLRDTRGLHEAVAVLGQRQLGDAAIRAAAAYTAIHSSVMKRGPSCSSSGARWQW